MFVIVVFFILIGIGFCFVVSEGIKAIWRKMFDKEVF